MGKSLLAGELRAAARAAGARWAAGRSLSFMANHPNALIRETLRDLLEIDGVEEAPLVPVLLGRPAPPARPAADGERE